MKKLQIGLELSIRRCKEEDACFVHDLMKNQMKEYFESISEGWSEERYWRGYAPERITIIEHEKKPVGFFDYEIRNDELYMHNLQLISEYHRKGIGREVISYVKKIACNANIHQIIGKVFKTNKESCNLSKRAGCTIQKDLVEENSYLVRLEV